MAWALATALISLQPVTVRAQTSPCRTNSDTAAKVIALVEATVTKSDSALLVREGIPYKPVGGVTLETDSTTCAAAINAYNGLAPADSSTHLQQAYVLRVGTSVFALMPRPPRDVAYYLSSAFAILTSIVGQR